MKSWIAAAATLCVLAPMNAHAGKPSLDTYGHLPDIEQIAVSPDGQMLAVVATDGERRTMIIRRTDASPVTAVDCGAAKVRGVQWAGSGHVLMMVSSTAKVRDMEGPQREYFMVVDLDVAANKQTPLLRNQTDAMNVVLGAPMTRTIDGGPVAFLEGVRFVGSQGRDVLFRVNLQSGATRPLDAGSDANSDGWLVDADGAPFAQSLYDERQGVWSLKIRGKLGWTTVDKATVPMGSYGLSGFGRDTNSVVVTATDADGEKVLREYTADGGHTDLPTPDKLDGLIHDPATLRLIGGVSLVGDELRYTFFSPEDKAQWDAVAKTFPGERIELVSWSRDRHKVVVLVDSTDEGPAYALVDLDSHHARWLGRSYTGLTPEGVSPVMSIKYKAADGLEISGYLTLPRDRPPEKLPLVVLPHGGPEGRDAPGFDWWSQALASHGYAVLRPNFRGSEGFGASFVRAGYNQWGKAMQTDLSDGVRYVAKRGWIDPKRVCIVGASYGGYAALTGATLDKGVYRCAVSVAGPSDLRRMLQDNQKRYGSTPNSTQRYWLRFMGADGIKDPDLTTISPAKMADKVDIPILLIHGKDDTVVPYVQSQLMADALKKAGKPVEFVTLDGEDHWLSRGASRLKMLSETVAFIEKNNPPN